MRGGFFRYDVDALCLRCLTASFLLASSLQRERNFMNVVHGYSSVDKLRKVVFNGVTYNSIVGAFTLSVCL